MLNSDWRASWLTSARLGVNWMWSTPKVSSAFSRFSRPVLEYQLWLKVTASGRSP